VDEQGNILIKDSCPTGSERGYEAVIHDMANLALDIVQKGGYSMADVKAIGIGLPGVMDQRTGRVPFCTNLSWHDVPIIEEMKQYTDLPVYVDNDATVAGLAESVKGVSAGTKDSLFVTLGTGVGGGIVINGRPWAGAHGRGGEIGHMTLVPDGAPCTCGNNGCVERYCSATAIIRTAKQECYAFPDTAILKKAGGNINRVNAKLVIDAAKEGDASALRVFNSFVKYLAMTINDITAFFDPDIIVLGGGVSYAGSFLLDNVSALLPRYQMFKALPLPRLALAKLGNEAGIVGAAMLGK
jgi:glucokinase